MPFPSDNISRFPNSTRSVPMTPAPMATEAELEEKRAAFLAAWDRALPQARAAVAEATAQIIADMRERRGRQTVTAAREDALRRQMARAETADEVAEICRQEAELKGGPFWCPTCGVELTAADTIPCKLDYPGYACGAAPRSRWQGPTVTADTLVWTKLGGEPPAIAALGECFPDGGDELADALRSLNARGEYRGGGGAAPAFVITVAAE